MCVRCLMLLGMADVRLRKDVGLIRRLLMLAMGKLYACARMDILDIKFPIDAWNNAKETNSITSTQKNVSVETV